MSPDPAAETYLWLSAAFDPPAAALLKPEFVELGRNCARAWLPASPSGTVVGAAAPWTECLEALDRFRRESVDDDIGGRRLRAVRREYARLFIGPPRARVRPYESCYFGQDALMTERTQTVRAFYASAGVAFDADECREPPDHIVVELSFLAMLRAGQTGHPPAERTALEQRFIEAHLGQWGRAFAARVLGETQLPLYRSAARLLDAVMAACGDPPACRSKTWGGACNP